MLFEPTCVALVRMSQILEAFCFHNFILITRLFMIRHYNLNERPYLIKAAILRNEVRVNHVMNGLIIYRTS